MSPLYSLMLITHYCIKAEMRQTLIILIIVVLTESSDGQYTNCIDDCPASSVPFSPLSYNTIRSHVFSGTQPSNGGCTDGGSIDGQVTTDCGQGTALLDCDSNFNGGNFSDLTIFAWNRAPLGSNQVSIIFKFTQQSIINVIRMFFWNSASDDINIPSVMVYWSDNPTTPSSEFPIASSIINGSGSGQLRIMTITGSSNKLQYLRIAMSFPGNRGWILLSEVQFCGSTAPYHITQPSTDHYKQRIFPNATTANITCALNISISTNIVVTWKHNSSIITTARPPNQIIKAGNTITFLIRNFQQSDLGVYGCIFSDLILGWKLRRIITLVVKTECIQLPVPANARIVSCSSGTAGMGYEGDTCSATCNTGYELTSGGDARTCQSDGSWNGSEIACRGVSCPMLTNPSNGMISNCSLGDDETPSYKDTCSFTCNTGYELTGSDIRTCQSDGRWNGSDAVCRRVLCSRLTNPTNGLISCSLGDDGVPSYEDTCSFTCNTGYELTGSDTGTCQSDGSWNGSDVMCIRVSCLSLIFPYDGIINCSLGDDGVPSYEDTCSFTCNTGYKLTGSDTRTCQSDGNWSGSETICTRDTCPPLTNPSNGMINNCSLGDNGVSTTCSFICNTGYELTGSDTRTCQSDGSWSGSNIVCRRVLCPTPTNPDNGVMDCPLGDDGVPSYEDTCSFTCDTGYELTGSDTRTCQSDGRWSGTDSVCGKVSCPLLTNLNGTMNCSLGDDGIPTDKDTCSFTCDTGYELTGSDTRTCQSNGSWDGSEIICKREILCVTYTPTGFCKDFFQSVFDHPVKIAVNPDDININQKIANISYEVLTNQVTVHKKCLDAILPFVCRGVFQTCDPAFNVSIKQRLCRRVCETLNHFVCNEGWISLLSQLNIVNMPSLNIYSSCDVLDWANGGDIPDCIDTLDGGKIPAFSVTSDCFTGRGRGYNGTISRTRSGKTCQRWSEQAPHQFILPSSQYPEIAGGHNYCRNPGSRAPEGPWCFTTDPNTRWEYCDVPKCDPSPSCELYFNDSDAICFGYGSIGYDYVFLNNSVDTKDSLNSKLKMFNNMLHNKVETGGFPTDCIDLILGLMCHHTFPLCDYSSEIPVPRQVCRAYCEEVRTGKCGSLWEELNTFSLLAILDCETLPSPEGGDYLECFIPYNNGRARRDINSTDCYTDEDLGIHYNGTLNVTESGRTCQKWDSDTPHSHPITSLHRYYLEDHNYCRNPEGRGKRPWCYTMNPSIRWEYCNVPNCSSLHKSTDASSTGESNHAVIAVGVVIPILIIVVLILVVFIIILLRNSRRKVAIELPSKPAADVHSECVIEDGYDQKTTKHDELPNIPRDKITYICDLGQGNFGMVMKGEAIGITPKEPSTLVAIKVLKEGSNKDAKNDFINEAVHMNQFDHPNILKLLGVCFDKEPLCLIFEYMDLGDLNNYLRRNAVSSSQSSSSFTIQQMVDMAIDIAAGLEYLAVHHFVHRDLATRNCLLNEKLFVKISDFGLSRDVYSKDYYKFGEKSFMPIRWMPPEAILYSTFTTQSDIWSFGVVLWEIFSSGMKPYCALSNEEVVDRVTNGYILRSPSGCPNKLYDLMVHCWANEPEKRPTPSEVYSYLLKCSSSGANTIEGYIVMKPSLGSSHGDTSPNQLKETVM